MYLKSLELQGFKSFPDKVKLEFDKGLTAVVGPNGSGKSNIGDAVRWVLGEQSTKNLRGGKMEDVIFSGTEKRKSVGFAQVTLNIDNSTRTLLFDKDIVSVSRKLYRSGESEYIINGENVRLKDVFELFMDTGLGKDGYAIIGQGKVAEIISSKSNDRREIFEEAAGISKFRYKKEEAERRLKSADENILRLRDIIAELEARVEPLKIQSEKAKKFLELAEEKKGIEISVWIHKSNDLKNQLSTNEDLFLVKNGEYESLENDLEQVESEIEQAYLDMQKCTVAIESMRAEILNSEKLKSQFFSEIAVLENDISHLNSSILQIEEKQRQSQLSAEQSQQLISQHQEQINSLKADEQTVCEEIINVTQEFDSHLSQTDELDKSFNEITAELNTMYIKKSEYVFSINSGSVAIAETQQAIEKTLTGQAETEKILDEYSREKRELVAAQMKIDDQLEEHGNRLSGLSKLYERKSQQLIDEKNKFSQAEMKIRDLTQRQKLLNEFENNMEGFANSVREVIKAGKTGRISGIHGTVAQLIKIDEKFAVAVETALGGSLQNVIVENEETAKRAIRMLKEQNSGRATFLPLTSIKGYSLNENGLDNSEGFVAIASEIVDCDSKYSGIIKNLLGRIVIAEDIDFAASIAKKYGYKFKIVTLDGQVINSGGSFTGGSVSRSTGVLTRKNEIEQIGEKLKKLISDSEINKEKLLQLQAEADKLVYDIDGEKDEISKISSDKIRFDSELKHITAMINQAENSAVEADKIVENLNSKLNGLEKLLAENQTDLIKCEEKISEKEHIISTSVNMRESLKSQREQYSDKLSQLKMKQIEQKKDIEACLRQIEMLENSIKNSAESRSILIEETAQITASISQKQEEISAKRLLLSDSDKKIEQITAAIKVEQAKHNEAERGATEKRNFQKIKNDEKEKISRELARVEEKKIAVQKEYDVIISELWEQYQLSRSEAVLIAVELANISEAQKRLNELKNKIKHLGNVNVAAIEEYSEVSERYEFMSAQLKDVEDSKSQLEKLIADLTQNMEDIFLTSFNEINANFKTIFVELFGGGKADLTLTDPTNILESGIEINVAPPGKVIKSLSLLSGGEQAFVAIAIYFAILKIKPSPFCILDEIEAALDDVNVTKYATYLRNFTDTTQFILITHRRGTMEESDVLYGVTMQEKGVSKLLKMDVKETVNISE